jgi:hypothetical protein
VVNDPLDLKARERTSFTSQDTIGSTFVARCAGREDANLAMRPNISDTDPKQFFSRRPRLRRKLEELGWRRGWDSHHCWLLQTQSLTDSRFLTIRSIRTKALVETRIEHAELRQPLEDGVHHHLVRVSICLGFECRMPVETSFSIRKPCGVKQGLSVPLVRPALYSRHLSF